MEKFIVTSTHNGKKYKTKEPIEARNEETAKYLTKGHLAKFLNCYPDEIIVIDCVKYYMDSSKYDLPEGWDALFGGFKK